jgi:photosystem II stability/assembly factor-like uncharacterized protein
VFKSTDGGTSWNKTGLTVNTTALVISKANPNILYAGTNPGGWCAQIHPLFKSTDGGASWSNLNNLSDCDISLLMIDPKDSNTLYAGSEAQYVGGGNTLLRKSTDGGETWWYVSNSNIGLASYGMAINPASPQTLYQPGDVYNGGNIIDSGLFKSTDGGVNWDATGLTKTNVGAVAINPLNPNTLYAGTLDYKSSYRTFQGVMKSTDGGASWFAINDGLVHLIGTTSSITALVIRPDNPNILYASTDGAGIFKSLDGGASWSPFNDGLSDLNIRALALSTGKLTTLYAGTDGSVYKVIDRTIRPRLIK